MWGAGGGASDPKIPTPASDIASSLINFFVTEDTSRPPSLFEPPVPVTFPVTSLPILSHYMPSRRPQTGIIPVLAFLFSAMN